MNRTCDRFRKRTSGFTLVEMIAAASLAAILCLGVMTVVASLGRTHRNFDRTAAAHTWHRELEEVLGRDLRCAQRIQSGEDRLALDTYAYIDPRTRQTRSLLVHVVYRLCAAGTRNLLLREQSRVDGDPDTKIAVDLVCADVKHFDLRELPEDAGRSPPDDHNVESGSRS